MEPYNAVCDILDSHDFITAYLNASFKGDVARFAVHTDRTEEEALAWYEADVFTPPSDLSEAYIPRYQEATSLYGRYHHHAQQELCRRI